LLRLCDSDVPMLDDIYEGTDRMMEIIQELLEEKDPVLFGAIKDIIISRWNKYNTNLHALAYTLNPKYYDEVYLAKFGGKRKAPHKDNEVANGFSYVALVSGTGGRRGRGDEFPGRLERTPNFSGDGRLGTAII